MTLPFKPKLVFKLSMALSIALLGMSENLEATPYSTTGAVSLNATVAYVISNASGTNSMALPAPSASAISAALTNDAGQNPVPITPAEPEYSVYTNAATPISMTLTTTSASGQSEGTLTQLTGATSTNTTVVPYDIVYTPCASGTPIHLANCTSSTPPSSCQIQPGNGSRASCTTGSGAAPGSIVYELNIPTQVYGDSYSATSTVTFSVGA